MLIDIASTIGFWIIIFWIFVADKIFEFFVLVPEEEQLFYSLLTWSFFASTFLLWHWYVKAIIRVGEIIYYNYREFFAKIRERKANLPYLKSR